MKLLIFVISLLTFVNCSGKKNEARSAPAGEVRGALDPLSKDLANKPKPDSHTTTRPGMWMYEKAIDKMGNTVHKASITSSSLLQFEFPYAGGSMATLTIRGGKSSSHAYIDVSKGQFNRSFQNGTARVRFDGKPAITYLLSAAANGRANVVFFNAERRLIDQIKAAKNMAVQVRFDGQPVRQIEFRTADLKWDMNTAIAR